MKKLAIIAMLIATSAFAEDAPQAGKPAEAPAAVAPSPPAQAPLPPTEWFIRLDQGMINSIASCAQEMKKREADPFLFAIDAQLKGQPSIIAAIKSSK